MSVIEKKIINFIQEHHVLTLATSSKNEPWCANCFYAYLEDENLFIFTSDPETKHVQDVLEQEVVAASIVLETKVIGKIRGLQIKGRMFVPGKLLQKKIKSAYLNKFPVTMLMKTTLWVLSPTLFKYTDNRLGFGKKIIWEKN